MRNHWWAEGDKAGTRVMLTTIAFAMTVDLRSQNRTPGVSLYPVGIAIDSARAVPEGPLLFHDSRKLCVLSHKLRIVLGLCDSRMSRGLSILSSKLVKNVKLLSYLIDRARNRRFVHVVNYCQSG